MTRVQRNLCRCLVVLVCLVFTLAVAQAQDNDAFIQYRQKVDVLPGMNAGASTHAVPAPIEGSGTA
jgi:hypothetical protein